MGARLAAGKSLRLEDLQRNQVWDQEITLWCTRKGKMPGLARTALQLDSTPAPPVRRGGAGLAEYVDQRARRLELRSRAVGAGSSFFGERGWRRARVPDGEAPPCGGAEARPRGGSESWRVGVASSFVIWLCSIL